LDAWFTIVSHVGAHVQEVVRGNRFEQPGSEFPPKRGPHVFHREGDQRDKRAPVVEIEFIGDIGCNALASTSKCIISTRIQSARSSVHRGVKAFVRVAALLNTKEGMLGSGRSTLCSRRSLMAIILRP